MINSIQTTGDQGNGGNYNGNGKDNEFSSPDDAGDKFVNGQWVFEQRLADCVASEECQVELNKNVTNNCAPEGTTGSWFINIKIIQPKCFVIFDQVKFLLSYVFSLIIRNLNGNLASNLRRFFSPLSVVKIKARVVLLQLSSIVGSQLPGC